MSGFFIFYTAIGKDPVDFEFFSYFIPFKTQYVHRYSSKRVVSKRRVGNGASLPICNRFLYTKLYITLYFRKFPIVSLFDLKCYRLSNLVTDPVPAEMTEIA